MTSFSRRHFGALSAAGALGLALTACGTDSVSDAAAGTEADAAGTVEVEDNNGTQTVTTPPASVVATDNRTFETLADWGITLTAAARALMPTTNPYKDDESIIDLGLHTEPDLEAVVAAEPTLIVNGQRFADYHDDFAKYAPEAAILELDPRDGEPFADELKRQVEVLGQVFAKEEEAAQLGADLDAAMERVRAAYDGTSTVMAVTTSGGEIGYIAPGMGRTLGWTFDALGFAPALEVEGASDDHQGDDISVEAIADSNPDWILVMDRDAAISADDPEFTPANEILDSSEALAGVTAVAEGHIVYMPADTYTNESIQTYTEFFSALADALEATA
ncbi:siderophore ABC transporter substrate-binding protein [Brachybacterium saurashtrense]|uniref:Iron ABC transporter substrate-binding protein n=1 Tax=Brachybacterium saurashtrense TaxID=556288 RepID=A0A345YR98_9MICO|nr:ABC transporter substrate-binding protein [Brachybacterium saurashtrense]AXK46450.1 iron ABC transporter substrate-binding protein [Brachybacterium saurashtrense]RRR24191.1 iron ABC transporter substrate-binding protein [Brachybacterium saurashtrense]